ISMEEEDNRKKRRTVQSLRFKSSRLKVEEKKKSSPQRTYRETEGHRKRNKRLKAGHYKGGVKPHLHRTLTSSHSSRIGNHVSGGLAEFDRVAFGVVEPGEATNIGIGLRVGHGDALGAELGNHRVEILDAEVDHPLLRMRRSGIAPVSGALGERS